MRLSKTTFGAFNLDMVPQLEGTGEFSNSKADLTLKLRELRARDRNATTVIDSANNVQTMESARTRQNSSRRGGFLDRNSGGNLTERYKDQAPIPIQGDNPLHSLN